jgi:hypothetical protein
MISSFLMELNDCHTTTPGCTDCNLLSSVSSTYLAMTGLECKEVMHIHYDTEVVLAINAKKTASLSFVLEG